MKITSLFMEEAQEKKWKKGRFVIKIKNLFIFFITKPYSFPIRRT